MAGSYRFTSYSPRGFTLFVFRMFSSRYPGYSASEDSAAVIHCACSVSFQWKSRGVICSYRRGGCPRNRAEPRTQVGSCDGGRGHVGGGEVFLTLFLLGKCDYVLDVGLFWLALWVT